MADIAESGLHAQVHGYDDHTSRLVRRSAGNRVTKPASRFVTEPHDSTNARVSEPGLDDPTAYQGYKTRFFRDTKGNVVQVYIDSRTGRVVNVLVDALNESVWLHCS
jgi:hypothetical protein